MIELTDEQDAFLHGVAQLPGQRVFVRPGARQAEIVAPLVDAGLLVAAGWRDRHDPHVILWLTQAGRAAILPPVRHTRGD